jgi:effector-binding domain-containing protein
VRALLVPGLPLTGDGQAGAMPGSLLGRTSQGLPLDLQIKKRWFNSVSVSGFLVVCRDPRWVRASLKNLTFQCPELTDPFVVSLTRSIPRNETQTDLETSMLDKPQILETETQLAALIRLTIPRDEIRNVMGPGMDELTSAVASQGMTPAGPIFSHHFRMDPDLFDFEIGLPIDAPISPVGRVKSGHLPAATVARTIYHGPYEGLGAAWGEFCDWIAAEGYTPAPDLWECYITGSESDPDPAAFRTELNRPLVRPEESRR